MAPCSEQTADLTDMFLLLLADLGLLRRANSKTVSREGSLEMGTDCPRKRTINSDGSCYPHSEHGRITFSL